MKLKHIFWIMAAIIVGLGLFKAYRMLTARDWTMFSECRESEPVSWSTDITGEDEPGQQLIVSGRLLESDGRTPIAGASIHMYHVDSSGVYGQSAAGEIPPIRLCGIIRTDVDGKYRFETIMPGAYPNGTEPAHIHYEVWNTDFKMWRLDLMFREIPSYYADNSAVLVEDPGDGNSWDKYRPVIRDSTGLLHINRDLRRPPWWKNTMNRLLMR